MKHIIVKDCMECPLIVNCKEFKNLSPKARFAMKTSAACSGILKTCKLMDDKSEKFRNMLEDVVNELDLSEAAIEEHGPLGTPTAELVRLVLGYKDTKIQCLESGFKEIK